MTRTPLRAPLRRKGVTSMRSFTVTSGRFIGVLALCAMVLAPRALTAQTRQASFTLADVLSPAFPYNLVAAKKSDRIAWIENERGMRNVYTAGAPDFRATKLTTVAEDDGIDLRPLQISDDGSVVIYIRGHAPGVGNRIRMPEWIANPASHPEGGHLDLWAAHTSGTRDPWRVAETTGLGLALSPDGRWL